VAFPLAVRAQTVKLQTAGITRVNADGSMATGSTTNFMNVFGRVNGADCYGPDDKGIEYVFPVSVTGDTNPAQHHLEVWAGGSDCSMMTARTGTTATCWPVRGDKPQSLTTIQRLNVRAQDIVSQISASTKTLNYVPATSAACTATTTEAQVTVYFLLVDGTNNTVGTGAAWPMKVKLVGPAPPTNVTAEGLDSAIIAKWTASSDTTAVGYSVFVDSGGSSDASTTMTDASGTPVTTCNDAGVDDAGNPLTDDAGNPIDAGCTTTIVFDSGGGGAGGTCGSSTLVSGGRADKWNPAATAGKTDTSATVTGLANGGTYAVAVATRDSYDNVGPLSAPACASPAPIIDFWSRYKGAGGQAGGFCALEAPGSPARAGLMAFGLAFAGALFIRRRGGRKG
jgi:hypothetical protein